MWPLIVPGCSLLDRPIRQRSHQQPPVIMVNTASVRGATICQSAALSELLHTRKEPNSNFNLKKNPHTAAQEVCVYACACQCARLSRFYQPERKKKKQHPPSLDDLLKCIEMYSYFLFTDY